MGVITLRCDHCGGEVQLDDNREFGFCMYCGTKIMIQQEIVSITVDASKQIENMKRLMRAHHAAGNHRDAGESADRLIDIGAADAETWYVKAVSIAATSDAGEILGSGSQELDACIRNYAALSGTKPVDARTFLASAAPQALASALGRQAMDIFLRRRGGDFLDLDSSAEEILRLDPSSGIGLRLRAMAGLALRGDDPGTADAVTRAASSDPAAWDRDLPGILKGALQGPGCRPSRILELADSAGIADDILCVRVLEAASRRRDAESAKAAISALGSSVTKVTGLSRIGEGSDASCVFVLEGRRPSASGKLMRLAFKKSEDVESFRVDVEGLLDGNRLLSDYLYTGESPDRTDPIPLGNLVSRAVSVRVMSNGNDISYTTAVVMGCRADSGTVEIPIDTRTEPASADLPALERAFDLVLLDESLENRIHDW